MHPRIAVSAVCSWNWGLGEDLAFWKAEGIDHVGLAVGKLDQAALGFLPAAVTEAGLRVSSVGTVGYFPLERPGEWSEPQRGVRRAQELAAQVGAGCVVVVSGPRGRLGWDEAAGALGEALMPAVAGARSAGVPLALENTASLRVDYGFVHTLGDALDLARAMGIGVCLEVNSCWAERGLHDTMARAADVVHLVQVSDFKAGTTSSPDRAVLGEGDIPLDGIVARLLEAGYTGPFEIELVGPQIEQEGYRSAILRSIDHLDNLLARLGA